MAESNGMERSRQLELRRMQIQRMQYEVAVEQAKLHVEELHDKIAAEKERIEQTEGQIIVLDQKIRTAGMSKET